MVTAMIVALWFTGVAAVLLRQWWQRELASVSAGVAEEPATLAVRPVEVRSTERGVRRSALPIWAPDAQRQSVPGFLLQSYVARPLSR